MKEAFEFERLFREATAEAFLIAKDHGFHERDIDDGKILCLIHSEISEALEALRKGNPPDEHCPTYTSLEVELADAVIRIMDFAGLRGLDFAGAIRAKMEYNKTRDYKHGKKF